LFVKHNHQMVFLLGKNSRITFTKLNSAKF